MTASTAVLTPKTKKSSMHIGLDESYRAEMSKLLSDVLASTYRLTIKSHIYHWNVVGPLFKPIHELTEEHYNSLFGASDVIAERIRSLGHLAPLKLNDIKAFAPTDNSIDHTNALHMVNDLIADHEEAVRAMREAAGKAGEASDMVTEDMITERLTFHEKALWMLRAIISE